MNRYLTALVLGTLLAAACVVYDVQADLPDTSTWPVASVTAVDVRADNGAIAVRAGADTLVSATVTKNRKGTSHADAEAHLADITTGDSLSGTTLYLWGKVPAPNTRSYDTEYALAAPAPCLLRLETANGAVNLDSMAGAAVVVAANGAVSTVAHSGSISVTAANGAIDCDIAGLEPTEAAALQSSNGRVTLYLPVDAAITFDITTSNGVATVTGFSSVSYVVNDAKHKTGTIGAGGSAVTLRSDNGNVTIQAR
ncbi:DUF4097 domain-containing protein [candidate division WOR-3 bacterium]|uniref:DUF4097 domain-containing protein n=1 Tax=candidate division WOR-3 bacterium TaxID=2052148 RepID=A0A937XFH2_UNCW3|nr:DUF4097 domain-containing protein [candidate division WOR-3 bacterium]